MSLIGGGHNFVTSMSRSPQDNFHGKNSKKSIKYSQSYDIVCKLAFLGGKGLSQFTPFSVFVCCRSTLFNYLKFFFHSQSQIRLNPRQSYPFLFLVSLLLSVW